MAPSETTDLQSAATCCGRCTALATPSCSRTPGTWPRREPWWRLDFPSSRPPAAAWPPRSGYEDHEGAPEDGYRLVINARVDVSLGPFFAGAGPETLDELVPEAVRRANAYLEAGADCVYPIALWETDALRRITSEVAGL